MSTLNRNLLWLLGGAFFLLVVWYFSDIVTYILHWPGGELRVQSFPRDLFEPGETLHLHIPPRRAVPVAAE